MGKRVNSAIWKEEKGYWQINVQKDGVRKSFYSSKPGRTGQREANSKADAWLDEGIENTNKRVGALFDAYIEELKLTTSRSNWDKIEGYGRNWIKPAIGQKKISSITDNDFQQILNCMYAKGLSKKTLLCFRSSVSQFLKYCRRIKVTTLVPEFLEIPKGAYTKEKTILQPDHLITLFSTDQTLIRGKIVSDPLIYAYRFQVLTGLRPGELIGLHWDDINGNKIHIRRSINIRQEVTRGKNENAIRTFTLTPTAISVLENQRESASTATGAVFPINNEQYYYKRWKAYREAHGFPHVTPYELRHTFVSVAKNLSEGKIKPLVGHSKNMDTLGTYAHEMQKDLDNTAAELEKLFTSILEYKG